MIRRTSGYQNIQRDILESYRQNTARRQKAALHIGTGRASQTYQYVLDVPLMNKIELRDNGRLLELSESAEADMQNDLYRSARTGSISRMGYASGILDLSSLAINTNTDSCYRGTIRDGEDVDYYQLNTMSQMISRRPVYITMEAPEGSDIRMAVYDRDGNQVGISERNEDGTQTLKVPCDWSSSTAFTLKIEGGSGKEQGEIPYRLTFRQGEMDPEFKALLERNKKKKVYETTAQGERTSEENRWNISEMNTITRENNEQAIAKLHEKQFSALPEEMRYQGGETTQELLARKRNGEELTKAEEEYLRIYGTLEDMADAEAQERIEKTEKELKEALSEAGISIESDIHVEIAADGSVTVSGLSEEENQKAADLIEKNFVKELKSGYLAKSEAVKEMTNYEYRIAMFTDELNRVLSKASGGRISMDDIRMVDRNEGGIITDYHLEGLPASLDRLINSPSADSVYEEYKSMCYAVLECWQGTKEKPAFHVRMDIGPEGIVFE